MSASNVPSSIFEFAGRGCWQSCVALSASLSAPHMDDWPPARLLNELDDGDDVVDSADDEELDSDAAFDESDEERFAGFFSSKKTKKTKPAVRFADVDLNEDEDMPSAEEEEEEDGDPDEFIDLLDVLDGKGEIDMGSDSDKPVRSLNQDEDQSEDSEDSEEEDEDDQDAFAPSEEEEPSDEFQKFISSLDTSSKKRKADDDGEPGPVKASQSRKKRLIAERTEAGAEDEFRAHASGSKLRLDDLLAPLSTQSSNLLSLKKNTKVLSSASTKVKTLSAPLPHRAQERLDREAAYEQTKDEVDKWSATMKRIREAEHLSFPLQTNPSGRVSNLELAAKFKPSTKLESSIDSLLKSAKLREEDLFQTEDTLLKSNNVTIEEISQRRSELRHMRELMFRAELKAKRINKIKSKTYRKIKRKEKEKLKDKILEAEGGESDVEGDILKREVERARERATLKHKQTGKWTKRMKQHEYLDENGREQIEEMLHRGDQLRRKIQGLGTDDESEDSDSSSDDDLDDDDNGEDQIDVNTEQGVLKIKKAAFDELQRLEDDSTETESNQNQRGVFQMKFMKEAMARKQAATDRLRDDFVKELGADIDNGSIGEEDEQNDDDIDNSSGILTTRTGGRMVYRPGAPQRLPLPRTMNSLASDTSSVTLKSTDFASTTMSPPPLPVSSSSSGLSHITAAPLSNPQIGRDESTNPWLTINPDTSTKIAKRKNEIFGKDSQKSEKSKNKLKKLARKRQEEKEKAQEDARVEISTDHNLVLDEANLLSSSKRVTGVNATTIMNASQDAPDPLDNANSDLDTRETTLLKTKPDANPKGLKAFQQRDLVALAFAGDNVVQEFQEAKKREMAADAPKDVDTTIPGWGSWGGTGLRKAPPKPERIKKLAGVDPKSRADYNKNHIIISEKRDKKALKYVVKDLPYPYTSRAQYERSMEQPLGKEWNTRVGFQRGTLPRVVKKPGIIIDPLEKMA